MNWDTYKELTFNFPEVELSIDLSRLGLPDEYINSMESKFAEAFEEMDKLEGGSIANPDEGRMVGHYWLRNAELAPTAELKSSITSGIAQIKAFTAKVHSGELQGTNGQITDILIVGIGGSALGPQFLAHALGTPSEDNTRIHFFDNTDPDGMDLALNGIGDRLGNTITLVISKSGGTAETRNGMLEAKKAYEDMGLNFAKHAVAVTGVGSKLDKFAIEERWIERFEMWDWVGGRTSVFCAVGLLGAALQGIDIQAMLDGAKAMDTLTRAKTIEKNPAALLALAWYKATNGKGEKDMVILPYKDRLLLFSRYLQQLIMESLGKEFDLDGNVVNQGIAVYGNKGSTDQHAYVQQLREGVPNFFATFIEVLTDRSSESMEVEEGITSGDFLQGFLLGSREALSEKGRKSITITTLDVSEESVAGLVALYERAVGFYATLVNINAYHQPGVEAGKKAAAIAIELAIGIVKTLEANKGKKLPAPAIAQAMNEAEHTELVFKICLHMAANDKAKISKIDGRSWYEAKFTIPIK